MLSVRRFWAPFLGLGAGVAAAFQGGASVHAASARQTQENSNEPFRHYAYLLYLPEGYAERPDEKFPITIFLHGAGERGNSVDRVRREGLPKTIETGRTLPFIVVSPQCPKNEWWNLDALDGFIDEMLSRYRVDRNRVYLTGLSMGGYATWALAARRPELYAAAVPICGGGDPRTAERLARLLLWVFHGAKDPTVPVSQSKVMVEAVERAGSKVRFTVYPDARHDSWTRV